MGLFGKIKGLFQPEETREQREDQGGASSEATSFSGSYALSVSDGNEEKTYSLREGTYRLGRASSNEIVLSDERISRQHASLEVQGSTVRLRALAAGEPIFMNGRAGTEHTVSLGASINIGPFTLRLLQEEETSAARRKSVDSPDEDWAGRARRADEAMPEHRRGGATQPSSFRTGESVYGIPKVCTEEDVGTPGSPSRSESSAPRKTLQGAFELSDEQRAQWIESTLTSLAEIYDGKIGHNAEGEKELRLIREGRPIRLNIDSSWLRPTLDTKLDNKRGMLLVFFDEDQKPIPIDPDDPWSNPEEQPIFLADGILLGDRIFEPVLKSLPQDFVDDMVGFFKAHQVYLFNANPDVMSIGASQDLSTVEDLKATLDEYLLFAARAAKIFEGSEQWYGYGQGVHMGDSVEISPQGLTVTCEYCNTLAILNQHSQCPTCGAPLRAN